MRIDELDLKELLEMDSRGGLVHFAGRRAVIIDAVAQGILRKELIDTFGVTVARGILSRFGFVHGRQLAESMRSQFDWDSEDDWRQAGPKLYSLQGLFHLEPGDTVLLDSEGGAWSVSYEAEQHLLHLGRADYPVCWTLCGLVSGYLSFCLKKEIYAVEDRCMGKGDANCHVSLRPVDEWDKKEENFLSSFKRVELDAAMQEVADAIKKSEQKLEKHRRKLASLTGGDEETPEIVSRSEEMRRVVALARTCAKVDSTILITGESGTGKERIARFIHEHSASSNGPFVAVNCGAISESLLESELFGHVRGAFTGANSDRPGLFEAANGGTLFLDEIAEIPSSMQIKLLRAFQEREVRRVGENRSRKFNARILTATNKRLEDEVSSRRFREDLYYRIKVVEVRVPPLRRRLEDILPLARWFLMEAATRMKRPVEGISPAVADRLLAYSWPGNVRELANAMERAVAVTETTRIILEDLPQEVRISIQNVGEDSPGLLKEVERAHILKALDKNLGNRKKTAQMLGIGIATLHRKLKAYGGSSKG